MRHFKILFLLTFYLTFDIYAQCPDVSNIVCTVVSPTAVNVSWTPPFGPIISPEGYNVFYREIGAPSYNSATQNKDPWINEIRYRGLFSDRGFEIIGPDELELECYKVQLFRANGNRSAGNNGIRNLTGRLDNSLNNYHDLLWDQENLDGGGGYIGLYYEGNSCDCPREDKLIEFLSFGNPNGSPDIGASTVHPVFSGAVAQPTLSISSTLNSIGLSSNSPGNLLIGDTPNDFTWQEIQYSPGAINQDQKVYHKLFGSNDQITIENLEPCTEYNFFIRSVCDGSLLGAVVGGAMSCTTESTISNANFKDQNGVFIDEMNICEGTNPNFMGAATFNHVSPDNTCSIQTTYFITAPNGAIVSNFSTIAQVNSFIAGLPNNPYLIQAIGHHEPLTGTGSGNNISNVNSAGCFKITSTPIDLKIFNIPTVVTLPQNPTTCGGCDGTITIIANNVNTALGGISYKLQPNPWDTNPIIQNLCSGTYTILVQYTDAIGKINPNTCFATATATLSDPTGPTAGFSTTDVTCNNGNDGAISLSPPPNTNYTYLWSNNATSQNIGSLSAGTYLVTITDVPTGCTTVLPGIQVNEPAAITINISVTSGPKCFGGNDGIATATANGGTAPYGYLWSSGATSQTAMDLVAGPNSVTVTDISGCQSIQTFTLTSQTQITASASEDTPVRCNGESNGVGIITAGGGTAPLSYSWTNSSSTSSTANDLAAGIQGYIVEDANGCIKTGEVLITEPSLLVASTSVNNHVLCNGESNGSATIAPSGGNTNSYTYVWGNGETGDTANALANGTTSYTVTDFRGCTFVGSVAITEPDVLVVSATITSDVTCNGLSDGVGTISHSGGTGPFTYIWNQLPGGPISTSLPSGTIPYTVIDANGCFSSGTIFVSQPAILSAPNPAPGAVSCFNGDDGTSTINPNGGTAPYTYEWDNGETTATAINLTSGTHEVTVTDANGCILVKDNIQISNAQIYTASATSQDAQCFGYTDGTAVITPNGGAGMNSVIWDANAGSQTTFTANGLAAGTYFASITDANGCVATASATVGEPAEVMITFPSINMVTCIGIEETITANATGGAGTNPNDYTYSWSNGTQGNAATIMVNSATEVFSVTATDIINGCVGEVTNTITGLAPPVMSAIDPITISENDPFLIDLDQFSTNDSISYNWDRTYLSGNCDAQNANSGQTEDELTETFTVDNKNTTGLATYSVVPVFLLPSGQECLGDSVAMEVIILPDGETATFFIPDVYIKSLDPGGWDIRVSDADVGASAFNLQVFNRSGAKVHDNTLTTAWTADNVQDGVYYYIITDGTTKVKTGSVLVQQ